MSATTTYGVTVEKVKAALPFNADGMNSNSPVTPDMVQGYIDRASARITQTLKLDGSGTDLSDDAKLVVEDGILAYACREALDKLSMHSAKSSDYDERWNKALALYTGDTSLLGTSPNRVMSTVNTSNPRPRHFTTDFSW